MPRHRRFLSVFALLPLLFVPMAGAHAEEDPLRLDPRIQPLIQVLELDLDPARDDYEGVARVKLSFGIETNRFRFHAEALGLGRATLDGRELKLATEDGGIVSATSAAPIPPGIHSFEIAFTNDFNRDALGLYKVEAGGSPYLFTQMEAVKARRSFPCWDEPAFKIPWQVSVTVPVDLEAVANMPVARESTRGHRKKLEFGRSPAMPSYLVALAVGKLESIDVKGQAVPGRYYTIAGQTHLAELAAKETPPLLEALENYFGIPFPYAKLDHVAVPEFIFGAMENAGLVTYRDAFFLFQEDSISFEQKRRVIEVIAHELAHMWFGNLVTMKWWDDLWLNESFATWLSNKIAEDLYPEMRFGVRSYRNTLVARTADSLKSVQPIRRTFKADANFMEAVDELTYNKGQAILRMVDAWLGEEEFQSALRLYFARHRWGNARAEDLWAAIADDGHGEMAEMLRRFVEQPGIPELTFTRMPGDRLEIRQERYRALTGKDAANQTWHIPVMLRYGNDEGTHAARLLLTNRTATFVVPGLSAAKWLYPNAGEAGYYTWALPSELAAALTDRTVVELPIVERLGVLNAAKFAVESGAIDAADWVTLLRGFSSDSEPEVQEMVVSGLVAISQTFADSEENRRACASLVRNTLRPMLDRLGFEPKPGEEPQWDSLRADLISALGIYGNDPEVIRFCREAGQKQLAHPRAIRGALADATLAVATWHGDGEWSGQVCQAFEGAAEPDLRDRFLKCLIAFSDPRLARSGLDFLLSDAVRPTDIGPVLASAGHPHLSLPLFEWARAQYPALAKKIPKEFLGFLPGVLAHGSEELLERGRKFFLDPSRSSHLAEVEFQKAAETVYLRAALRERHGAEISKLLTDQAKK